MFHEDESNSMQRSLQSGSEQLTPDPLSATLLRHIGALEDEVARLRESLREKDALEATVTRLREANEHLVVAAINAQGSRDDAEATNRRQNEFLAMLAHELRNPLVPISMSATLLERSADASPQLLNFSKVIRRQVDHMARLLDDLLDAARISSGKITLSLEPMPVSNAIDQALETVLPRIRERGQHLYLNMPEEPAGTRGDRVRLTQVFANLLNNAAKYTDRGGRIWLDAQRDGDMAVVRVRDNGTGIAPEVLPHIFDLFTQGPRSLARSEGGLGVGLNLVRRLVELHGGSVSATSAGGGAGSSFTIRLPRAEPAEASVPAMAAPEAAYAKPAVLLIEDNEDGREMMATMLDVYGYPVLQSADGLDGVQQALTQLPKVALVDIGLPGIDGYEVARRLRANPETQAMRLIALTGYGLAEDQRRVLEAGFDMHLVKPVDIAQLLGALGEPAPLRAAATS